MVGWFMGAVVPTIINIPYGVNEIYGFQHK
jgi:hypothetical protein